MRDLSNLRDEIWNSKVSLYEGGIRVTGLGQVGDYVEVMVMPLTEAARAHFERYGSDVRLVEDEAVWERSVPADDGPVRWKPPTKPLGEMRLLGEPDQSA